MHKAVSRNCGIQNGFIVVPSVSDGDRNTVTILHRTVQNEADMCPKWGLGGLRSVVTRSGKGYHRSPVAGHQRRKALCSMTIQSVGVGAREKSGDRSQNGNREIKIKKQKHYAQ